MNATNLHDARLAAFLRANGVETVYGLALLEWPAIEYLRYTWDAHVKTVDAGLRVSAWGREPVAVAPLFDSVKTRWLYTVAALDAALGNE